MKNSINKLLVLSSGGDAPGMNAAIRAVVRTGIHYGMEVFGCHFGYKGLLDRSIVAMSSHAVANCIQRGGTILHTNRFPEFKEKAVRDQARAILSEIGINAMVVIGGDGSFRGASLLQQEGGPAVMGIPATIDNDIQGTEYTLGFNTACNTALDAIDKIRDTASSHNRHFLVEVMGRNAGFLAVEVGIAGGAEFILIPERPISTPELVKRMQEPKRRKSSSIMVVAEADHPGRSFVLSKDIEAASGIEYKVCILGHTQRGGSPTVVDRKMASIMGVRAVEALREGVTGHMTAIVKDTLTLVPFPAVGLAQRAFKNFNLLKVNGILCG